MPSVTHVLSDFANLFNLLAPPLEELLSSRMVKIGEASSGTKGRRRLFAAPPTNAYDLSQSMRTGVGRAGFQTHIRQFLVIAHDGWG
jgi:hypothetical protein